MFHRDSACLFFEETRAPYICLTERHLQALWLEQKYLRHLQTSCKQTIQVLSPGVWNPKAGPAFRNAILRIAGEEARGDIAIHLSPDEWASQDPLNKRVILLITLWPCPSAKPLIPIAFLEESLTLPHARLVQLIDLDLFPYKKYGETGRCGRLLFPTLEEAQIGSFFQRTALWRLAQKREYLERRVEDLSLHLAAGIAMAMGLLELFLALYPLRALGEEAVLALALGACGFFAARYRKQWAHAPLYRMLHAFYLMMAMQQKTLAGFKVSNLLRLVYLAKLIVDPQSPQLLAQLKVSWERHKKKEAWGMLHKELKSLLPSYEDPHWNYHSAFEATPQGHFRPLIGERLRSAILIEAFLPLLQGVALEADFRSFFATLPAQRGSKARYLQQRFFGTSERGHLLQRADCEQGALQLHHDFCQHYKGDCAGCPFVDRYLAQARRFSEHLLL